MAKTKLNAHGFGPLGIVLVIVVILAIGGVGYVVANKHVQKNEATATADTTSFEKPKEQKALDPSQGGAYLFIKEWNVRARLPETFKGTVAYEMTRITDPDSKLPLEAAYIYVASTVVPQPNNCEIKETSVGKSIAAASAILRSDVSKPFNTSRYNHNTSKIKENILTSEQYAYHLSYGPVLCLGDADEAFGPLQTALQSLEVNKK